MKEFVRGKRALAAWVLAAGLALASGGCAGNPNYQEGISKADDELNSGSACIYSISMADVAHYEPKTGLPYLVLETPVTPELLKMIEGHNATIYAKYHGGAK